MALAAMLAGAVPLAAQAPAVHARMPYMRAPHLHLSHDMTRIDLPGPDSAQVAAFLGSLSRSEPMICEAALDGAQNVWRDRSLVGALREQSADAPRLALAGSLRDARALPLLAAHLGDANPCVRRAAARILGDAAMPSATERLRVALTERDGRVREAAALGLGEADDSASAPALGRLLRDGDPYVARMAAWALGSMAAHDQVPALIEALRHPDAGVRVNAAWALGQMQDTRALGPLTTAMKDSDAGVRRFAAQALGQQD